MSNETALDVPPSYVKGAFVADKYLLEQVLEEGGMGSVWLAHNIDLDAPVAIKLVRFDAANQEAADRLRREARVEARLEHRAIVRVFDCGETEKGDPFIAMELLHGMSLAAALDQRGPMSMTTAVQILLPVIDGLSAAHDKGIVHRDIKPSNIFLATASRRIQPKVLDFGIAKLDQWSPNPRITLDGTVIGSPSYMAPEQARGCTDVDHRADIWAICAVLYESITSSPPFRGRTYNSILRSIVEDDVAPLTMDSDAARALWPILERGFSKDRERRFQSMRDLGTALAQFLIAQGVDDDVCGDRLATTWALPNESERSLDGTQRPTARSVRRARSAGALLLALGILAFALWKTTGMASHANADSSPGVAPFAPPKTVDDRVPAEPVPATPAPEASATTPSVDAVVSPPLVTFENRAEPRPGARPKRPTATNASKRASESSARPPPAERTDGADAETLGLKIPYGTEKR
jgi:serine/threonine-protein kinase